MTELRNSDTAIIDQAAAIKTIRNYFEEKQSPALLEKHLKHFRSELAQKKRQIKETLLFYPVRQDGYFKDSIRQYRSFSVHWFIVFYSYEEADDEVVIWFIRSSKSDYSNVLYLDQSR